MTTMKKEQSFHLRMSKDDMDILNALEKFLNSKRKYLGHRITKADIIREALFNYRGDIASMWRDTYSTEELQLLLYPDVTNNVSKEALNELNNAYDAYRKYKENDQNETNP